jgi:hypothetical protein
MLTRSPLWPLALLMLLALLAAPARAAPQRTGVLVEPARTLTVNGPFRGLGAQDDSNLLWSEPNRQAGARAPRDFLRKVAPRLRALRMPVVRKFVDVAWFAPRPDGYTWDSPMMRALYTNLRAHRANGSQVMLTIWSLPPWLAASAERKDSGLGPAASFPSAGLSPDYEARWAEVVADLMRHLYGLDGSGLAFDNIAYLGGPNELAEASPARLVRPYSLLRERLREAGLADAITLFGPDAFVEELPMAIAQPGLDPLLGLYDFHYYAAGPVEAGITAALDRLAAAVAPTGKQLWLTEFGEVEAKNDDWRTLPSVAIAAMNHGAAAALMWNTQDQIYNTGNMPSWGLWGVYDSGYRLKPAYYAWQMLASRLPSEATVYGHSCDREQCAGLRVAVLGDAAGGRALILLNLSDAPHQVSVELGELAPRAPLHRALYDPAVPPRHDRWLRVPIDRTVSLQGQPLTDTLPPGALAVYSTVLPPDSGSWVR